MGIAFPDLTDDFEDGTRAAWWAVSGGSANVGVAEAGGQLQFTHKTSGSGANGYGFVTHYNMIGQEVVVEMANDAGPLPRNANVQDQVTCYYAPGGTVDGTRYAVFLLYGNTFRAWSNDGAGSTQVELPWDRVAMRWWRIRFTGGLGRTVVWEYSADGITWTSMRTFTTTWPNGAADVKVVLTGVNSPSAVPTQVVTAFDNFRLAPAKRPPRAAYYLGVGWTPSAAPMIQVGVSTVGGAGELTDSEYAIELGGTYVDESVNLKSARINRGRSDDLGAMQAGTASFVLRDPTGRYNPKNPASPLAGSIVPNRPVQLVAKYGIAAYADSILFDVPTAYWPMDDTVGLLLTDISGNTLDATTFGGPTLGVTGLVTGEAGKAVTLATDEGASLTGSDVDLLGLGREFTVSMILKTTQAAASWIFTLRAGIPNEILTLRMTATGALNAILTFDDATTVTTGNVSDVNDGNAHHVLIRYDSSFFDLWVDGTRVAHVAATKSPRWFTPGTGELYLGASGAGATWLGTLDEVAVWPERALEDARIAVQVAAKNGSPELASRYLFRGFIRTVETQIRTRNTETTIEATDLFSWLANVFPTILPLGQTTTGGAIAAVLDTVGVSESFRFLDVGDPIPGFSADGSTSALALIESVLEAERGVFFTRADGRVAYFSRQRWATAPSRGVVSAEMRALSPGTDLERIRNKVTVTRQNPILGDGTPQTSTDADSRRLYGPRDMSLDSEFLMSDLFAEGLAQYLLSSLKDPVPPLWQLTIVATTSPLLNQILQRGLQDRITVTEAIQGTAGEWLIEQIEHNISEFGQHSANYILSERRSQVFLIGTSTLDGPDRISY